MRRLILMALCLAVGLPAGSATVTRTVRATGQAAVIDGNLVRAAEAARSAALREAVESGIGVLISSTTRVGNFAIIEDEIFAATRGYVRSFEIISQGRSEDGTMYEIFLEAQVDLQRLEQQLAAIDLAHAMAGRPRFVCRGTTEDGDGRMWSTDLTRQLRQALAPLGEQLEPTMAAPDALVMVDTLLASTYLADVLVDGNARFTSFDPIVPGSSQRLAELGIVSRRVALTVDIRWLDEGSAMNQWSATGRGAANDPAEAERKALQDAVSQLAQPLRAALVEDLRGRAFSDHEIQLLVDGTPTQLDALEQMWQRLALTSHPLRPHGRDNGQGRYSVQIRGSAFHLARRLSAPGSICETEVADMDMEILQVSANRLRLQLRSPVTAAVGR